MYILGMESFWPQWKHMANQRWSDGHAHDRFVQTAGSVAPQPPMDPRPSPPQAHGVVDSVAVAGGHSPVRTGLLASLLPLMAHSARQTSNYLSVVGDVRGPLRSTVHPVDRVLSFLALTAFFFGLLSSFS